VFEPLAVTTSCLDTSAKKLLRQQLTTLGGHLTSEWQRGCALLVMNKISVTIKVHSVSLLFFVVFLDFFFPYFLCDIHLNIIIVTV